MHLESFLTRGLGDTSYLLASDDESLIVDPQRDIGPVLAAARARGQPGSGRSCRSSGNR